MSNSLINETSPYLLSHSENPVNWYPWGEEAFAKAHREDKPLFISIGYSTCHWCHVMARESFEDEQVAQLLNNNFVSIKVDREERSDVDSVYMRACVALNGSGGWPLTVIADSDGRPFYAGTYLPKDNVGQRMGLISLLKVVAAKWSSNRAELLTAGQDITALISRELALDCGIKADKELLRRAAGQLHESSDKDYGGFGIAPKFPSPHMLLFLLRYAKLSGDGAAKSDVELALRQMYRGGIFDHIGGGFARYSTDREWLVPHFEKTLYDNALLSLCYTEAWEDGHFPLYRQVAEATLDYCLRELKDEHGGFFTGQDADSQGEEGAYYLLTPEDISAVIPGDEGRHFAECFDITAEGNFHGKSIPNLLLNQRYAFLPEGYDRLKEKVRLYRARRMPLFTDKKILTGMNGLMLMALSRAGRVFGNEEYLRQAEELSRFMAQNLSQDGKIKARLCSGELRFDATLSDLAFYALGLLELYRADFDPGHIGCAAGIADEIITHYRRAEGGYYLTPDYGERLIVRPFELYDNALPSGNSAAALLFRQLFALTGDVDWGNAADELLTLISQGCGSYPAGCAFGLCALLDREYGETQLVCVTEGEKAPPLFSAIVSKYSPGLTVMLKTPTNGSRLEEVAPFTKEMQPQNGQNTYYICRGGACSLPITEDKFSM